RISLCRTTQRNPNDRFGFIIITAIRIKTVKGGDSPSFNLMVILKKNHAHPLVLLKAVYRTAIVHDQAKITGWLR
uniref:hypothetical protein n=1 Tax=Prevotella sp. TaxID=59823 RepID=UPI0040252448